jgi:anti-sigma regulatory factor (Ser/Thr protein kinase)
MASDQDPEPAYQTVLLPNDADAPAIARNYVLEHAAWLRPDLMDDALVLVSELVTNAIRYGRPQITLGLRIEPPGVGVTVQDSGALMPDPTPSLPPPMEPTGRGLFIVDALSQHWGVTPTDPPPGKTVWFELGT